MPIMIVHRDGFEMFSSGMIKYKIGQGQQITPMTMMVHPLAVVSHLIAVNRIFQIAHTIYLSPYN